ncbi:hypothetical protein HMPREF0322_03596 [Desulfitobacterium hafniense DP7]|uniref:Uncharacterized protein n=2 Tax=Desulfitobacterium hafniense TaxID=49338 RepID=Q24YH1_DESHY|nr:hypothetical protein HMPREF0322_03596 [Desulfitobacterium hafniense DP7]BAE82921.1 hypothetical protein DSY1132 [Desulfitobacterium hafniense Y51]
MTQKFHRTHCGKTVCHPFSPFSRLRPLRNPWPAKAKTTAKAHFRSQSKMRLKSHHTGSLHLSFLPYPEQDAAFTGGRYISMPTL